jgi:hypothetical protein
MGRKKQSFRGFFYFRTGYVTYFTIFVGLINILSSTYFLAIKNIPWMLNLFPNFTNYAIFCIVVGIPLVIIVGWLHLKKVGTYAAETDISNEESPYNYKLVPGFSKEVFGPAYLALLRINIKKVKGEKLSTKEISEIKIIEEKLQKLIDGEYIGNPPSGAL